MMAIGSVGTFATIRKSLRLPCEKQIAGGISHLRRWGIIWDPGRRRCSAAAMKDSMAAT